ncbi:hypothetical protein ACIA8E_28830 [Streptomyces sp. NPDC051664]|uniref:hypothetical protein n=1 Tax=Streptomyces sp. NPDC051664 TaxID=3365668 RepID=UPI0037BD73C0
MPGTSIKDGFADPDLTEADFQVLFEAEWIHCPGSAPVIPSGPAWRVPGAPDKLLAWDDGDGYAGLIRSELLEDPASCSPETPPAAG